MRGEERSGEEMRDERRGEEKLKRRGEARGEEEREREGRRGELRGKERARDERQTSEAKRFFFISSLYFQYSSVPSLIVHRLLFLIWKTEWPLIRLNYFINLTSR